MGRIIWDQPGNPPRWVSDQLGIERPQLKDAIHKIKRASGLRGDDRVIIHDDGSVTDDKGEPIGNIFDEI
jgi:hypothetical protein